MTHKLRIAGLASVSALALALTACQGGGAPATPASTPNAPASTGAGQAVTLTWWHNMNSDPGMSYWAGVAKDFEAAHPGVTIDVQVIQNEDLRSKLKTVLQSPSTAPVIFQQWGGGEMADQVKAGYLEDITAATADSVNTIGAGNVSGWQVDGKTYGLPYTLGPEGIYYSKDLFQKAGVDATTIKTLDDLNAAVQKLKDAKIQPIAVGAKDAWPAGHWYYNFALRACSTDVMKQTVSTLKFDDPCWLTAAQNLKTFADTQPFNRGFLTTAAQQGAGSAAGLVANHRAAMDLMGVWEPGVIGGLTPDKKDLPDLGWFPFPQIPGGQGDPNAAMAGGDGMSCYANAPAACAEFLNYMVSDDVQAKYAATGSLPSNPNGSSGLTNPVLQQIAAASKNFTFTQLWLDTAYGASVGNAINSGVVNLLAGKGTPEDLVKAMNNPPK